jgi:hypothetical protein
MTLSGSGWKSENTGYSHTSVREAKKKRRSFIRPGAPLADGVDIAAKKKRRSFIRPGAG